MNKPVVLALLLLIVLLAKPLTAAGKAILVLSQSFPQIPVKPLNYLNSQPRRETVALDITNNKVIIDLFLPVDSFKHPAVVLAMGVKTEEKDRLILFNFADSLARLGFIVAWPRTEALATEMIMIENPQTFVETFKFLENRADVRNQRISFVGFSVGSSLALVAAEDLVINRKVHGLVFFGGYYSILDYLRSLATQTITINDDAIAWQPAEGAISHAQKILQKEGSLNLSNFLTEPPEHPKLLLKYSPDQNINRATFPVFILHDQDDPYVPYVESIKLKNALSSKTPVTFHLSNLFEHAQVSGEKLSPKLIGGFLGLLGFLYKVLIYL